VGKSSLLEIRQLGIQRIRARGVLPEKFYNRPLAPATIHKCFRRFHKLRKFAGDSTETELHISRFISLTEKNGLGEKLALL